MPDANLTAIGAAMADFVPKVVVVLGLLLVILIIARISELVLVKGLFRHIYGWRGFKEGYRPP